MNVEKGIMGKLFEVKGFDCCDFLKYEMIRELEIGLDVDVVLVKTEKVMAWVQKQLWKETASVERRG